MADAGGIPAEGEVGGVGSSYGTQGRILEAEGIDQPWT